MCGNVESLLKNAIEEEQKGNIQKALSWYKAALDESEDNQGIVLYEIASMFFGQGIYDVALEFFVKCYRSGHLKEEVLNIIMDTYYNPNMEEYKKRYEENIQKLSEYEFVSNKKLISFQDLNQVLIPYTDNKFIRFDRKLKIFLEDYSLEENREESYDISENEIVIVSNECNIQTIAALEEKCKNNNPILWIKNPFYLYYDNSNDFLGILSVIDIDKVIQNKRVVFLLEEEELENFFLDLEAIVPEKIYTKGNSKIFTILEEISDKRNKEISNIFAEINDYYADRTREDVIKSIQEGTPKIMFLTSRFTTALQYYTRDCVLACQSLGIPNRMSIEKSDIHRSTWSSYKLINEFKPDVIFCIDHFRYEMSLMPDNLIYVTWIQDPLAHLMSGEAVEEINEFDFILNLFISSEDFFAIGYPEDKLIDAIIPVNENIYKKYDLTVEDKNNYAADICLFSNAGNPEKGIEEFLKNLKVRVSDNAYEILSKIFYEVYHRIYDLMHKGTSIYSTKQYKDIIVLYFEREGIKVKDEFMDILVDEFRHEVGFRILRSVPIEWLHEKGCNIKIWGKEWLEHPKLSQYAMGVAENGETLSRIINASKIVLGTNQQVTSHPRIFETILSGTFYIGPNIPTNMDEANIRKYMVEDEEIVLFYDKQDLYEKVDYYLNNEIERNQIIKNGQKKVLADLTYESLMKKMIKEIGDRLEI